MQEHGAHAQTRTSGSLRYPQRQQAPQQCVIVIKRLNSPSDLNLKFCSPRLHDAKRKELFLAKCKPFREHGGCSDVHEVLSAPRSATVDITNDAKTALQL